MVSVAENRLRVLAAVLFVSMLLCGCGGTLVAENAKTNTVKTEKTVITIFAAKSLNNAIDEIIKQYEEENPAVKIQTNFDSSGTLMMQIAEGGAACDIFFSASDKQVNALEEQGLIVEGTRDNILKNLLCVVTYKGSNTQVSGLSDMGRASSLAIAGESVPVGDYTRKALVNAGIVDIKDDRLEITSDDISKAFSDASINECLNAGAVVAAIIEQSNEVGTIYYSDISGHEDTIQILEMVPEELTGEIVYPVAQVINPDADDNEISETLRFMDYLKSDAAKVIFEKYNFVVE